MLVRLYSARCSADISRSSAGSRVPQPYQPARSAPLKSAVNPSGGTLSAAGAAFGTSRANVKEKVHAARAGSERLTVVVLCWIG